MSYIENEYKEATKYEMKNPDIGEIEVKITTEGLTPHERRMLGELVKEFNKERRRNNMPRLYNIQKLRNFNML